jgi:hypothetical protein
MRVVGGRLRRRWAGAGTGTATAWRGAAGEEGGEVTADFVLPLAVRPPRFLREAVVEELADVHALVAPRFFF